MESESNPRTATPTVLKGVVAFVEVRSSNDNRSAAIAHELSQLGAKVEPTFSDEVTHVVYKEGLKRTWNRATKRGVPMVSVSWIDSCKQHMMRMPESSFPALLPEESNSPLVRINYTSRWKKMRSMQPCDFEEEVARSAERGEKKRKRVLMANRFKLSEEATPNSSPVPILAMETQPRSLFGASSQFGSPVPDTPPSMKERLERMRREQMNVLRDEFSVQTPKVFNEMPLQKRLFERLASDFTSTGTSSDEEQQHASDIVKKLIHRLDSDDGGNTSREGLSFKPLISGCTLNLQKNLSGVNDSPNTSTIKQNHRRSLRKSSGKAMLTADISACGEPMEEDPIKKPKAQQHDKRKLVSHSPPLALSPKDINICTTKETVPQVCSSSQKSHSDKSFGQDTVLDLVDNAANKASIERECENSGLQSKQRRRSCRNLLKSKHCPGIKSFDRDDIGPKLTKDNVDVPSSESLKKKRNLYTEPVLDASLPKPSQSKRVNGDIASKVSDLAFLFGTSENDSPLPSKTVSNRRKKKSSASNNKRHYAFSERKSICDQSSNESSSNEALSNSMSIMYGNDTLSSSEKRFNTSRRSIHEFRLSEKPLKRTQNGKISEKSKLDQIKESEPALKTPEAGGYQAAANGLAKSRAGNSKRTRDSGSSCDSVEANSSKKQKLFSSDGEDRFSSPQQLRNVQPRLRHARSLVMEPALVSTAGVHYSLVVTSLHRDEQELVYSVLKKLGVFRLTNTVDWSSTHIVCGEPRRTLNLLKAIAQGCWILSKEWVFKSLEAGTWLAEENFEMYKELPVVKKSRLARQTAGDDFRLDLFSDVGPIFVAGGCKPPRKELVHLIQLCRGKVTGAQSKASLCIGETSDSDQTIIKPTWILDSIMKLECLPVEDYIVPAQKPLFQRESSPEF
ncbi:hypothetical protein EGW08_017116 [Elysia chlorotica]|uniref:BRCT domain-containing protein n=1 Tax=Elysia chlorotica TaxID=188477 RepID=A0A433T0P4_ELYCH|nr:hypothetical protein EGW08_017116 [Elysia chlorotica]